MIGLGTLVNVLAIVIGGMLGLLITKGVSDNIRNTIMQGIGLAVLVVGSQMALKTENMLLVIGSLTLGGLIGELVDIEDKLERLGKWIENRVGNDKGEVAKGFVTASLLFCVGAMAIMGSLEDGLTGNATTLYVKSMLDGISSIVFASTMGIGVIFSAIPVLIYQGLITLLASYIKVFLNDKIVAEMTATGGILIIGIAFNMLGFKTIKVGNLLPAVFIVIFLAGLISQIRGAIL